MNLVQKLLGLLHRVFDPDPEQFLAMRLSYAGTSMVWAVADNTLTTTVVGGEGQNLSINLLDYTLRELITYITEQPGYTVQSSATSERLSLAARTLIDGTGNQSHSNGDHLYSYTSLLWSFLSAAADQLRAVGAQIPNAIKQMTVTEASDDWIDELGGYYGVLRQQGESDASYGPRIIAEVVRPRCNNIAMEAAISLYTGQQTKVTDVVIYATAFPRYNSAIFRNSAYNYQLQSEPQYGLFDVEYGYDLLGGDDLSDFATRVRGIIEVLRAAGTHLRGLLLKSGAISDTFTPPTDGANNMPLVVTFPLADTRAAPTEVEFSFDAALGAMTDSAATGTESEFSAIHHAYRYNSVRNRNSAIRYIGDTVETSPVLSKEWSFLTGTVPPDLTFVRASTAMRYNQHGVLEVVAVDVPRLDYAPLSGIPNGLLIEETRTNLAIYSSTITDAAWSKVQCTVTAPGVRSPDDALAACLIVPNTSNVAHAISQLVSGVAASTPMTQSVFVKAGGYSQLRLRLSDDIGFLTDVVFDAATGARIAGSTDVVITALIDGWYRIELSATTNVGATAMSMQMYVYSAGSSTFAGDGVKGIYVWHAQIEAGSFATSPIPTAGAPATRLADLASVNTLAPWYNDAEGTLCVSVINRKPSIAITFALSFGADTQNYIGLGYTNSTGGLGSAFMQKDGLGPNVNDLTAGRTRLAAAWNNVDLGSATDGGFRGNDASAGVPLVTNMQIGWGHNGGAIAGGHYRKITYWNKRFPDGTLKILSEL
jgi:hypothetical protein